MSDPGGRGAYNFGQWERAEQLRAFYAWLPSVLNDAPGIDWAQLPPEVMGCCIRTIGTSPDAAYLAMAAASAYGRVSTNSLVQMLLHLHSLFTTLRKDCGMERVCDLRSEKIWKEFAAKTGTTMSRSRQLSWYSSVSTKHYPQYLHTLAAGDASLMQQYQLPAMPDGFLKRVGNADKLNTSSLLRRQPVRNTLVPLFPLLRQLVLLRKELAGRMFHTFQQFEQGISPDTVLPVAFHYTDSFPELQQQEQTWEMRLREVPLHFFLWNKRAWILAHQDRYSGRVIREAEQASGIYSPERDSAFVQFNGAPQDLFWFGDLIKNRLLQYFQRGLRDDLTYEERWTNARDQGFPRGCTTKQPGLLRSDSRWFAEHTRDGDLLFEPEAVCRGILYAAALSTLAMTNGGSVSELLQVAADGWINTPEGRKQLLLPDGAKGDDRRLFTISPEAVQMLEEIERGLVETFGEVPITAPARQSPKSDRLRPARYLFQWQKRMVDGHDTQVLVRFLLHGVNLVTESGTPIPFSMNQIRYGGNLSTEERGQELLRVFGFNHTILQGSLSFSSLRLYCRDFYAYWQFAGSREVALQPETLAHWISHLRKVHYKTSTINRMVVVVQNIMGAAASPEQGYVDPSIADAFQTIKKTPERHHPLPGIPGEASTPVSYRKYFKKCGRPWCTVCQLGEGHGPYWYAYWRENGRSYRTYIGRKLQLIAPTNRR